MREKTYFSLNRYFGIGDGKESQIVQVPVEIGVDTIPDELECYLRATGKRYWRSYKELPALEIMVYLLTDKLRAYHVVCPEQARIAGEKMIGILESIDHDDDTFPESQISWIREIIG